MKKVFILVTCLRFIPHWLLYKKTSYKEILQQDILRNLNQFCWNSDRISFYSFCYLMTFYRMFRNIFYARIGMFNRPLMKFLTLLASPQPFLDITSTSEIGGGLIVQHGYNTLISPAKMGRNCWVNQGVSIGHRNEVGQPEIGDNVRIAAGALVLGALKIGRGATIAPGAVVMRNVPPYAIVMGNPAKVVGFNKTPEEIIAFEKLEYPEGERLPLKTLEKNYNKYYIERREEIAAMMQ